VRRTIPRNRLLRWLAFFVYTGSAGAVLWCSLMVAMTLLATQLYVGLFPSPYAPTAFSPMDRNVFLLQYNSWSGPPLIVFGYVLCYCLTTVAFRNTLLRKLPTAALSCVAAVFGLLMCVAPYLVAFFVGIQWRGISPWWLIGGPLVATGDSLIASYCAVPLLFAWSIACVFATLPWLNAQWVRFLPYPDAGQVAKGPRNTDHSHADGPLAAGPTGETA
jgi:hypothetical protein